MAPPRSALAIALAGIAMTAGAAPAAANSPDKEGRIAFGLSGADGNVDVYSVRPDGRAMRRLTDSPGFDACPAYARGGRQIAFCSDRTGAPETWVMREDGGGERQVTNLGGLLTFPDFSPDGRQIAMSGRAPEDPAQARDLWVTNVDGSDLHRLTDTPDSTEQWPAYSPDGNRIAFVSNRGGGVPQVWRIDTDGRDPRQLTSDPVVKEQLPDWSPNGTRIAYAAAGDIWVMNADGSDQVNLTHNDEPESGPAWSPGGRRIAFLRTGAFGRLVHTIAADGSDVRVVHTEGPAFVPAWQLPARTLGPVDLGTFGGSDGEAIDIGPSGVIVGGASTAEGVFRAARWVRGRIEDLGAPGPFDSEALDINAAGVIVGTSGTDETRAFVWRRGRVTTLPGLLPDGVGTVARRLNDRGVVAGSAVGPDEELHAVIWRNGVLHELPTPTGFRGAFAQGINNRGDVVGAAYNPERAIPIRWSHGVATELPALGQRFGQANVIDDRGRTAGLSGTAEQDVAEATAWERDGTPHGLGQFPDGNFSIALGTNGHGDYVGAARGADDVRHAFVSRGRGPLMILPALTGDLTTPTVALGIDEGGNAVGTSDDAQGNERPVLWPDAFRQAFIP